VVSKRRHNGEFNVCQFFPDGTHEYVVRWVDAETALVTAQRYTHCPAAQIGMIVKVIITDGDDFTNFQWEFGKGVTYPPEASGTQ
jgi:hypothetical protein